MRKIYLIILFIFFAGILSAQSWLWSIPILGADNLPTEAIKIDNNGDIITLSELTGNATIGSYSFTSNGAKDLLIIKTDKIGNILWIKQIGGAQIDDPKNVYIDKYNNIFITGSFEGSVNFGSSTIASSDGIDAFVAKYDKDGNEIWAKNIGEGNGTQKGRAIISDGNNLFITGFYFNEITLDNTTFTGTGIKSYYFLKLNNNGDVVFVKNIEHKSTYNSILLNNLKYLNSNLYLSGYFSDTLIYENDTIISNGDRDIVLFKFNSDGNLTWIRNYGDNNMDECWGMDVDANNIYMCGHFIDSLRIGDIDLNTIDGSDIFIAKIDENGTALWARSANSSENNRSFDLIISNNNIYISGYYSGNFLWGDNTVSSPQGNTNPFIGILSTDGVMDNIINTETSNNTQINIAYSLTTDNNNHIFLTGFFRSDNITFNSDINNVNDITITNASTNKKNGFIAKYGCFDGVTIDKWDAGCNGNDGKITVTPNEGAGPFNYNWSNGATTQTISNLGQGDYTVTVSDNAGCSSVDTIHIYYIEPLASVDVSTTDVLCAGDSTGEAIATPIDGGGVPIQGVFSYEWSNGDNDSLAQNLPAGNYTVTVTGRCNMPKTSTITIYEPDSLDVSLTGQLYNYFGTCIAHVYASASGGTPGYSYEWFDLNGNSLGTDDNIWVYADDYYIITVTDANGCFAAWWFYVPGCNKALSQANDANLDQDNQKEVIFNNNNGGFSINSTDNNHNNISNDDKKGIIALIQKDMLNDNLNVYPNPSNRFLNVSVNNLESLHNKITIYNSLGSIVYQSEVKDLRYSYKIDVSKLEQGVYFIEVNTEINKYRKQIVIAR